MPSYCNLHLLQLSLYFQTSVLEFDMLCEDFIRCVGNSALLPFVLLQRADNTDLHSALEALLASLCHCPPSLYGEEAGVLRVLASPDILDIELDEGSACLRSVSDLVGFASEDSLDDYTVKHLHVLTSK